MAVSVFMKFTGPDISGGSNNKGHETEIEVIAWNHGFNQPTSSVRSASGGGTVEKCNHQHFTFSKQLDSATDDLLKYCWSGQHIDKGTLTCYRSSGDVAADQMGVPYLQIDMESIIVADYSIGGGIGEMPMESISLNYAKVTYTYTTQDKTEGTMGGAQVVSHDLRTNVAS